VSDGCGQNYNRGNGAPQLAFGKTKPVIADGTIVTRFDEEKMNFGGERRLKSECRVECDDGRPHFSTLVFTGSGKSVDVQNLGEFPLAEDALQNLVLRLRMRCSSRDSI